jgi:hypothetical protein
VKTRKEAEPLLLQFLRQKSRAEESDGRRKAQARGKTLSLLNRLHKWRQQEDAEQGDKSNAIGSAKLADIAQREQGWKDRLDAVRERFKRSRRRSARRAAPSSSRRSAAAPSSSTRGYSRR